MDVFSLMCGVFDRDAKKNQSIEISILKFHCRNQYFLVKYIYKLNNKKKATSQKKATFKKNCYKIKTG